MTRLDSAIRRLAAQRELLDWGSREAGPEGLVLEIGLGNGRTYDHLRDRLPGREIYAFERSPAAHPDCYPPEGYLIVGDLFDTLGPFIERHGRGSAALIHIDIGSGDEDAQPQPRRAPVALSRSPAPAGRAAAGRPRLRHAVVPGHLRRDERAGGALFRLSQGGLRAIGR